MKFRKTYERLTQAINEARDRGDIETLDTIAAAQQEELEQEIEELVGRSPF